MVESLPQPLDSESWRSLRHRLAWLVSTHRGRLAEAFGTDKPPPPPRAPLRPLDAASLLSYFGLSYDPAADVSGHSLFTAAHHKHSSVLALWHDLDPHDLVSRRDGPAAELPTSTLSFEPPGESACPLHRVARPNISADRQRLSLKLFALDPTRLQGRRSLGKAVEAIGMPPQDLLSHALAEARTAKLEDGRPLEFVAALFVLEVARIRHLQLFLFWACSFRRFVQEGRRDCREHGASVEIPGTVSSMLIAVDSDGRRMLHPAAAADFEELTTSLERVCAHFLPSGETESVTRALASWSKVLHIEMQYQIAKQPLLRCYANMRFSSVHAENSAALTQLIEDELALRPRVDVDEPSFEAAVEAELTAMRIRAALTERVLAMVARERMRDGSLAGLGDLDPAAEVAALRELDALLRHLIEDAAASAPWLGTTARCELEAVVLAQVLTTCDRQQPPRANCAWPSREEMLAFAAAQQGTTATGQQHATATESALSLWPLICALRSENEALGEVLRAQSRLVEWRSWLEVARSTAGGGGDSEVLARGAQFDAMVRSMGAAAFGMAQADEGARSLMCTLLAERRLLLAVTGQAASFDPQNLPELRAPGEPPRNWPVSRLCAPASPFPPPCTPSCHRADRHRATDILLLAEEQARQRLEREKARRRDVLERRACAKAIAVEAPLLARSEALRDTLRAAEAKLHATEVAVTERQRQCEKELDSDAAKATGLEPRHARQPASWSDCKSPARLRISFAERQAQARREQSHLLDGIAALDRRAESIGDTRDADSFRETAAELALAMSAEAQLSARLRDAHVSRSEIEKRLEAARVYLAEQTATNAFLVRRGVGVGLAAKVNQV